MPLTNDIVLNGVAYSVVPGAYRKLAGDADPAPVEGAGSGATARRRLTLGPFGAGQRQAFLPPDQLAAGRAVAGWDSLGVGPVFDGSGVEPFPKATVWNSDALLDTTQGNRRIHTVITGGFAFMGNGQRIYKSVALSAASWSNWTVLANLGGGFEISGLTPYDGDLLVLVGSGADIRRCNITTGALTTWSAGQAGVHGVGYKGQLIYSTSLASEKLKLSGTKWNGNFVVHTRYLDAPIVRMAPFNGKVAIATRQSLWLMGGEPYEGEADDPAITADTGKAPAWLGDPEPLMTHGIYGNDDDFAFLCSYRGRLYTWLEGRVCAFDDSQEEGRWLRMGPEGLTCRSGCVAGDWLVVAIEGRYGNKELWGYDGEGWWLLDQRSTPTMIWPGPLGGAGTHDLVVFRAGETTTYDLYRLKWRSAANNAYRASGDWTSGLIDAGDATRDKRWRAMGATFAAPVNRGNAASADTVVLGLDYSIDGGVSWTQVATSGPSDGSVRTHTLATVANFAFPTSRYVQVRVRWSSVSDWAPVLTGVWIEAEPVQTPARKRRWELAIDAGDRGVRRDGQMDSQTGRQKIVALWDAWELGASVIFKDIDNDTDPVDYTVTIEAIEEKTAKPGDAARWGESQIALTLAEI